MQAFLALDSSTSHLCLSLVYGNEQLDFCEDVGRDHAKRILPEIENLLARSNLEKCDLTAIAVGLGPGSYTGVRVAMATAKGLARALTIPLYGYPTLEAIASRALGSEVGSEVGSEHTKVMATLDARREHVYAASYTLEKAKETTAIKAILTSDIAKLSNELLKEKINLENLYLIESQIPDAAYFAKQAKLAFEAGKTPEALEAIYL